MSAVELIIGNKSYRIAVPAGGEEKARLLAARVDALLSEIRKADASMDRDNQLILAALQLAAEADGADKNASAHLDAVGKFHAALAARLESLSS